MLTFHCCRVSVDWSWQCSGKLLIGVDFTTLIYGCWSINSKWSNYYHHSFFAWNSSFLPAIKSRPAWHIHDVFYPSFYQLNHYLCWSTTYKFTTTLSSPINTHSIAVESQHRNCNAVVPDPIFSRLHTKEKIVVWLHETIAWRRQKSRHEDCNWLVWRYLIND